MTNDVDMQAAVTAYIAFYEGLAPDNIDKLEELCTDQVRFRDPFNDVTGIAAYRAILARMFKDVKAPHFKVIHWAASGRVAYLRWTFTFTPRRSSAAWLIDGMSEVHFDERLRVVEHLDHWDAGGQFYARLPLLRTMIKVVRKRLAAGS